MQIICKYCGATSTTQENCSNCGAPIDTQFDTKTTRSYSTIKNAINKHFDEAGSQGIIIGSNKEICIKTKIYIDNKKCFEIYSRSGNIGRYKVFAGNQDVTIALTKLKNKTSVILPGRTYNFGDNRDDIIATISEILTEIDPCFDESRIRIDSAVEQRLIKSIIRYITSIVLTCGLAFALTGGYNAEYSPFLSCPIFYILLSRYSEKKQGVIRQSQSNKFIYILCATLCFIALFILVQVHGTQFYYGDSGWKHICVPMDNLISLFTPIVILYFVLLGIYSYKDICDKTISNHKYIVLIPTFVAIISTFITIFVIDKTTLTELVEGCYDINPILVDTRYANPSDFEQGFLFPTNIIAVLQPIFHMVAKNRK